MLGLPASTEIKKLITKKKVFEHFGSDMSADRRKSFDADIGRIILTNEISPVSLNLADGNEVHSFFVVQVVLRQKDYDKQNIAMLAKMFGQNLVLVLEYEEQRRLALWQTHLITNEWAAADSLSISINGLNMDAVWAGAVTSIAGIQMEQGRTLNEQIALSDKKAKLQREIDKTEKLARNEKQPKKKFELVQMLKKLRADLEAL